MKNDTARGESLKIEPCRDTAMLASLFQELVEDEPADVLRTEETALKEMEALLARGEKAYIFTAGSETAGYALVIEDRKPPYLHQFYTCRNERRKGYGTAAFALLLETLNINEMDLDVYVWNERGRAFWESLGFKPRAIIMRYSHDNR